MRFSTVEEIIASSVASQRFMFLLVGVFGCVALIGAAFGGVAAFAATRVLRSLLYSVSTTDPVAFTGVLVLLCVVALVASYLPARRASRREPMDVLRGQ